MPSDIRRQAASVITSVVSSRYARAAARIAERFSPRGTDGLARMSDTTSCMPCRLSKMIAASGNRAAKTGATAAVIGIACGIERGGSSSICRKRATAASTPIRFASGDSPVTSGS